MRSIALLGLCLTISGAGARPQTRSGCSASDYAPESIPILAQPSIGAKALRSIPREDVASLANVDAVGNPLGDWLKVRAGESTGWVSAKNVACRLSPKAARDVIATDAARVIAALKTGNMAELARYVHPTKGLRLSPYATVDAKADVVMAAAKLNGSLEDPLKRVWGSDDGSGKPIRLPFPQYYRRFIYDRDFLKAPRVTYNGPGEGARKAWEAYPSAIVVEYHFPENDKTAAESLRLVFERHHGKWYLAGIIHDGWTV